jgi:hypothetical protein
MAEPKSICSDHSTEVNFQNKTRHNVEVLWLDYQGKPVWYNQLPPGKGYRQQTYVTHPWVCVETDSGRFEMMVLNKKEILYPEEKPISGVITEPERTLYELCRMSLRLCLLEAQGSSVREKLNEKQVEQLPLPRRLINDILVFDLAEPSPLVADYVLTS